MATIRVKTAGQKLVRVDCPRIASGDKNIDYLQINFCPDWNGYAKQAVFYRDENNPYYAIVNDDNTCLIPWEVLQTGGLFYFGIIGIDGERRKTSETISYMIASGITTENLRPSNPTPENPPNNMTTGVPPGGKAGQYLRKKSDIDGDVIWSDLEIPKQYGLVTYNQDKTITIT
jgi:hypothetical protein